MNWLPTAVARDRRAGNGLARLLLVCTAGLTACGASESESAAASNTTAPSTAYTLRYTVTPNPTAQTVDVRARLRQDRALLREMRFTADPERFTDIRGNGELVVDAGSVRWMPPETGGKLSWRVSLPNRRNGNGYDAWLDDRWGLFRAEDIIPPAATRALKSTTGQTELEFRLPDGWSVVTEYARDGQLFPVVKSSRRFDQPTGWIVIGDEMGVRRERISGVRIGVAAPADHGVRRLDIIALLNWTLPELARVLPRLPDRLTIVSAGDPMWRGALSAPQSIYLHADRPLISENGTSTLLHEVMHVALGTPAEDGFDWIVEGLAEYYSLQLLRRSGTLTPRRYERAMARQREWSTSAASLCGPSSTGARTALAVVVFEALAVEITAGTSGEKKLDDVVRRMLRSKKPFSLTRLQDAAAAVLGGKPNALHIDKLPGCRNM